VQLGPRVLGEELYAIEKRKQQEARERGAELGFRVTDTPPQQPTGRVADQATAEQAVAEQVVAEQPVADELAAAAEVRKPADVYSLNDLRQILSGPLSEAVLDRLEEAEFARVEGPRSQALRMLIVAERKLNSPARAAVIRELEAALQR
jgi:methylmalonyl-CoA mutase cobalamin-binding subunit